MTNLKNLVDNNFPKLNSLTLVYTINHFNHCMKMKIFLSILIPVILIASCTKNNEEGPQNYIPPDLIGKWKIFEVYYTSGSIDDMNWVEYDSGKVYDIWFKSDGTFQGADVQCDDCTFIVSDDNNIFFYPNGDPNDPAQIRLLNSEYLTLWWKFIEGAGSKYRKIIE